MLCMFFFMIHDDCGSITFKTLLFIPGDLDICKLVNG